MCKDFKALDVQVLGCSEPLCSEVGVKQIRPRGRQRRLREKGEKFTENE